ncbi:MAG TPA: hypothetical protein VF364_12210 [Candidatus Limnocylindria bacterium]
MSDDRFDRELGQRLRAYESRIPDAEAPLPAAAGDRRPPWAWLIGVGALGIVAAGMLVLVLVNSPRSDVGESSPSPIPTASPAATTSAAPSAPSSPPASSSPSASTQPEPTAASADLTWTETGSFGTDAGAGVVNDLVAHAGGLIAVGTEYEHRLPVLGPAPPRDGRVWGSADGRSWTDRTPDGTFDDVQLRHVYEASDGTLVAIGTRMAESDGQETFTHLAWESTDGVTWRDAAIDLPDGSQVNAIERGAQGYLAWLVPMGATHGSEIWFSPDGRAWERVRSLVGGAVAIGAGGEGFVVSGSQGPDFETVEPFTIASSDGREWFEASNPPPGASGVLPIGGDWIVIAHEIGDGSLPDHASVWHSTNGLDWSAHGELPLESVEVEGARCTEVPAGAGAAGGWLVAATSLAYPCSEGGFVVHGSQRISTDGAAWTALPLDASTPGEQGSGSNVRAAATFDGRLILVGEANLKATFWIGEAP